MTGPGRSRVTETAPRPSKLTQRAPLLMMAWVTDVPSGADGRTTSLPYRFLVAMQGSLGIGNNLNKWSSEDFATAKQMIAGAAAGWM